MIMVFIELKFIYILLDTYAKFSFLKFPF